MLRIDDVYGVVLLTICSLAFVVLLLRAMHVSRIEHARYRFFGLLTTFSIVCILAVWLIDDVASLVIITGFLLPVLVFFSDLLRFVAALAKRATDVGIVRPLLRLVATSGVVLLGSLGCWIIASPDPFVNSSETFDLPKADGWTSEQLDQVFADVRDSGALGMLVIHDGTVVAEWGDTTRVTDSHSVRKSLLSVLIGIAVDKGLMDIGKTLADLGFDDTNPALSPSEQQATLRDLLTSSSGIYHGYVGDEDQQIPARGSHPPGEFFYYNNWSFNALGALFEQQTGLTIGAAMDEWIAKPIGLQDFRPDHVVYRRFPQPGASRHAAYRINISIRDLARIGLLMQQNGSWAGKQIVSESWVEESTHATMDAGNYAYGYSWWRSSGYPSWASEQMFFGSGTGGQKLLVDPALKVVAVFRVDTSQGLGRALWTRFGAKVSNSQFLAFTQSVLAACGNTDGCPLQPR
jgi:CubicO group peptidase (beta-lactamase class C family)